MSQPRMAFAFAVYGSRLRRGRVVQSDLLNDEDRFEIGAQLTAGPEPKLVRVAR